MNALIKFLIIGLLVIVSQTQAQETVQLLEKGGLEDIIVEKFYVADEFDSADNNSGDILPEGSVTYRIYIDLKPGYKLQMVYAYKDHPIEFNTSTKFFNNEHPNRWVGSDITVFHSKLHTAALDSWVTINTPVKGYAGVLKEYDTDGSIYNSSFNTTAKHLENLLLSNKQIEFPITDYDGMIKVDSSFYMPRPIMFNFQAYDEIAVAKNDGKLTIEDGAIAILEGVEGPTDKNQILIAQFTTDGDFSFKLNLQVITPLNEVEIYLAENPEKDKLTHPALIYPRKIQP